MGKMGHCNQIFFRDFENCLLQYALLLFIKTLALQLTQKSKNTLRKSTNVKTLVRGLIRPKIAKQSFFSTQNIRIVFETTARRRQVKIRDDANKLSDCDQKNLTPRSLIGSDEYASRLKQTQLDHSFDLRTSNTRTKARYKKIRNFGLALLVGLKIVSGKMLDSYHTSHISQKLIADFKSVRIR